MKFICDVHIPFKLVRYLSSKGYYAIHTNNLPRKWHSTDHEICVTADSEDLIVITKDEDFRNSFFVKKTPKKLIRITLGNISNQMLITLLDQHLSAIQQLDQNQQFYVELGKVMTVYTN